MNSSAKVQNPTMLCRSQVKRFQPTPPRIISPRRHCDIPGHQTTIPVRHNAAVNPPPIAFAVMPPEPRNRLPCRSLHHRNRRNQPEIAGPRSSPVYGFTRRSISLPPRDRVTSDASYPSRPGLTERIVYPGCVRCSTCPNSCSLNKGPVDTSLRKTIALPLTHATAMYKPRHSPAHRCTWNTALRIHVFCGRFSQPFANGTLFSALGSGEPGAVEDADWISKLTNVPC